MIISKAFSLKSNVELQGNTRVACIMPCFNAGKYLKSALDGLCNQTERSIARIVVNDGSTDDSLDILTEAAEHRPDIFIINQTNQGMSSACNSGAHIAAVMNPSYVLFPDSDDIMHEDMIATMADY